MPITRKHFSSPFLVEKSKLTRLLEVVETKFKEAAGPPDLEFEVHLRGQKVIETNSIEHVFSLDNSEKSRVGRLSVSCTSKTATSESSHGIPARGLLADFDGSRPASISLTVKGDDPTWVSETFSAAEEQIERTLERSFFTRVSYNQTGQLFLMAAVFLLSVGALFLATSSTMPTRLTNNMWLTTEDIQELQSLPPNAALTKEKTTEVLSRQLHNLAIVQQHRPIFARILQTRFLLIAVPSLVVLGAFAYLYFRCYPHAVFLWGDAEDWYNKILSHRKFIWSSIIIAILVGILRSLFLLGLRG